MVPSKPHSPRPGAMHGRPTDSIRGLLDYGLHLSTRILRNMSTRSALVVCIILIALLSFLSLLTGSSSGDIYYPALPSSRLDRSIQPELAAQLQPKRPARHSYKELYTLPSKFMLNEDGTAALTVVIHPQDFGISLLAQIRSLLAQTVQPEIIWIAVSELDAPEGQDIVQQVQDERVSLRILDPQDNWFQLARKASTEFFLLMENGVTPGTSYLATLLRLAHTPEYSRALLGSHGAILPDQRTDRHGSIQCHPSNDNKVSVTEHVDALADLWFGRTETLELLSLELYTRASKVSLSVYFSTLMRFHGSIPSIVIANDPHNSATWGDTRTTTTHTPFCKRLAEEYKSNEQWHNWIHRGRALVSQQENRSIMLVVLSSVDDAYLLQDLICRLSLNPTLSVHVAVAGSGYGISIREFARTMPSEGCHVAVYDLKISEQDESADALLLAETAVNSIHVLNALRPKVMLYLSNDSTFARGLQIAQESTLIPSIVFSAQEIEYVKWLPDLDIQALASWNVPHVNLVVITNNRPGSCIRLLRSLNHAHYLGDKVSLTLNMDAEADRVTMQMSNAFLWENGQKYMRHRVRRGGLMLAVVESWFPQGNDEYAVLLEDDVEVSPLFYSWIKYNILRYRYSPGSHLYHRMFGVSLYSQKFVETHLAGRSPFNPEDLFIETPEYDLRTPFLLQLPCSWGAVYFPEHWREFHEYVADRLLDIERNKTSLQSVQIPMSRTNRWSNSWKKLFIEMIYMRGYVMLYPNFFNFTSFSTNHLEWGTHTKQQRNSAGTFLVPLMTDSQKLLEDLPNQRLPDWDTLPVLDLWANLATSAELIKRGRELQEQINPCLSRNSRGEVVWEGQEMEIKCPKTLPYYSTHTTPLPKTTASVGMETISISDIMNPTATLTDFNAMPTLFGDNSGRIPPTPSERDSSPMAGITPAP